MSQREKKASVLVPRFRSPAVAILVDFDNFYLDMPLDTDSRWITHELNTMVSAALQVAPSTPTVLIRFYGGWLDEGTPTKRASLLLAMLQTQTYFPMKHPRRGGTLDGEIALATRLAKLPSIEWSSTLKKRKGLPRFRLGSVALSSLCGEDRTSCPVHMTYRFSRDKFKRCPKAGCTVTSSDAFVTIEQKMVDTLLACDLTTFTTDSAVCGVIVMCNDVDILPAIAFAKSLSNVPVGLIRHDRGNDGSYDEQLRALGVTIDEWRLPCRLT